MDQGILFEPEADVQRVTLVAGEVDSDGCDRDWLLRLGETELDHESALGEGYFTWLGRDSTREMWY